MTKKCTGQNPPWTVSAKPGDLSGGKGRERQHLAVHDIIEQITQPGMPCTSGSTKGWSQMLLSLPEYSKPFTDVEIQVPGESGTPDALHSPKSTPCGGAEGLPFISPIIKPLDKEWAESWMFCACLVIRHRAGVCLCPWCTWGHTPCPYCSRNISNNVWHALLHTERHWTMASTYFLSYL